MGSRPEIFHRDLGHAVNMLDKPKNEQRGRILTKEQGVNRKWQTLRAGGAHCTTPQDPEHLFDERREERAHIGPSNTHAKWYPGSNRRRWLDKSFAFVMRNGNLKVSLYLIKATPNRKMQNGDPWSSFPGRNC